jgi:diaminohydroxyphosphoribosylaminopyrimidine deaminase/5-amino-6-(5-phosphoribosylamino)uracil reductase
LFKTFATFVKQRVIFMSIFDHENYMSFAISLARRAEGKTKTNPMVGACIVFYDKIIGFGWHTGYGFSHAEVEAVNSVPEKYRNKLNESTLYVTLEPCNHQGKTPPCTQLILEKQFKSVIIGCRDPNPLVSGKGIEKIRSAGILIIEGVLEDACLQLIKPFKVGILENRPYIHLKWAQSSNKMIGETGKRTKVSNSVTLRWGHQQRAKSNGILVGYNTVVVDDPELTVRYVKGQNPTRIIVDIHNSLEKNHKIFNDEAQTILIHSDVRKKSERGKLTYLHIPFHTASEEEFWKQVMSQMYAHQIGTLLVEGGAKTHTLLMKYNLWDKISIIESPIIITSGIPAPEVPKKAVLIRSENYGDNSIHTYVNQRIE